MAFRTKKISQMDPKGSNLASTDLLEISELVSGSYVTKSITGAEIAASAPAAAWGTITGTLSAQTDLNTALSGKVPTTRTLTINGTTQDLSADRTFTVSTGITIGTTAITSGTVGRVLFQGTGNVVQESANLFWDNTNGRLGINTSTPAFALDVVGSSRFLENVNYPQIILGRTNTRFASLTWDDPASEALFQTVARSFPFVFDASLIRFMSNGLERMRIFNSGNVGINTTTDAGFKLDVNGTARVSATLTALQLNITGAAGSGHVFSRLNDNGTPLRISNWSYGNSSGNTWVNGSEVASSLFALNSTTKGFLPPRMDTTQKNAIATPATGLMVYDTTLNLISVYNGTIWISL